MKDKHLAGVLFWTGGVKNDKEEEIYIQEVL
jgi:hypothetical protein